MNDPCTAPANPRGACAKYVERNGACLGWIQVGQRKTMVRYGAGDVDLIAQTRRAINYDLHALRGGPVMEIRSRVASECSAECSLHAG